MYLHFFLEINESIFMNKITNIYTKFKNTRNLNSIYGKQNVFRIAEFLSI